MTTRTIALDVGVRIQRQHVVQDQDADDPQQRPHDRPLDGAPGLGLPASGAGRLGGQVRISVLTTPHAAAAPHHRAAERGLVGCPLGRRTDGTVAGRIDLGVLMGSLDGRVAIVTGASRGIGAEIARRFAAEGARVAVSARTTEAGQSAFEGTINETVQSIVDAGGTAVAVAANLARPEDRARLVAETEAAARTGRRARQQRRRDVVRRRRDVPGEALPDDVRGPGAGAVRAVAARAARHAGRGGGARSSTSRRRAPSTPTVRRSGPVPAAPCTAW